MGNYIILIFLFPVGLFMMWKFANWSNTVKIIATIAITFLFVISVIIMFFVMSAIIGFMMAAANSNNAQEVETNQHQDEFNNGGALGDINVKTKGFGDTKPITSNDSKEGQQKKRRVEMVIDKK